MTKNALKNDAFTNLKMHTQSYESRRSKFTIPKSIHQGAIVF